MFFFKQKTAYEMRSSYWSSDVCSSDLPASWPAPIRRYIAPMSTTPKKLKIASWNINPVRFRLELVERFLREEQPDVLCRQETKVINNDFPAGLFRQLGYNFHVIHGQPMHHGVAILSKVPIREEIGRAHV